MKQITNNRYVKPFRFTSSREISDFIKNQGNVKFLYFEETYGDNYYCYIFYNALTKEKLFILSFRSEEIEENLNFLFWNENKLFVLDTGNYIYLIDNKLDIVKKIDVNTPLIGIYLTHKNDLLLLEEASLKLIDSKGNILKEKLFDLLEDFNLENEILSICTSSENINIDLT